MSSSVRRAAHALALTLLLVVLAPGAAVSVSAETALTYSLSTTVDGSGVIQRTPTAAVYGAGSTVELSATPNAGWLFKRWEIDAAGSANPIAISINRDTEVRAVFVRIVTATTTSSGFKLTLEVAGDCCGTVTADHGTSLSGIYSFASGDDVVLTASTNGTPDLRFLYWEGDLFSESSTASVRMDRDKTVRAVFVLSAPEQYQLSATTAGAGSVTMTPDRSTFTSGQQVALIATPNDGWRFDRWEGAVASFDATTTFTVTRDAVARAIFVGRFYGPKLIVNVDGLGFVQSGGEIVGLTNRETGPYTLGARLTLRASAFTGWRFDRWTGDVNSTASTITITMDGDRVVRPIFVPTTRDVVALSTEISGSGSVTIDPPGFGFQAGELVTLVAEPANGWRFDHWEQDASGNSATTKLNVSSNLTARAVFVLGPLRYTLATEVIGAGSIAVSPAATEFSPGSRVTVTAVPATGYRFVRWLAAASGSTASATVVMTEDLVVGALFELSSSRDGELVVKTSGGGQVSPFRGTSTHPVGTELSLRAEAQPGWRFARWQGSVSGIVNPIRFSITGAMTVEAIFVPSGRVYLALETSGDGSVTTSPSGTDFVLGTSVRVQAFAAAGWRFERWEGDAVGSDASATLTLAGDRVARAVFVREPATTAPPASTAPPVSSAPPASSAPAAGNYLFLPAAGAPGLAVFGGGTFEQATAGMESIWTTRGGKFFGYVAGAPLFVNGAFTALFSDGTIPGGTPLFVFPR